MAFFLNIETSTEICSICISEDETILALKDADDPYVHAGSITLLIQDCLKQAGITLEQLSAVSVSSGPGSYTALRIGTSTAKGICYALDKPLISIDTLQALAFASAQKISGEWIHCPMIDARRMEVYTAMYDSKGNAISDKQALIVEADSFDAYFSNGKK
ncbi:MAG: tRNA (adenosine(37)-N6)-threonylcarbamoyltransferase complex dimerization subunit type 1 TsaB, partial [Bacteroidetes bacterium]|nr:tRNA (adenosine(37)-N6)-threonylcarbamoyltransferase complex dimerization subunit type 1 TsaB [Bacteroidota bacterium]